VLAKWIVTILPCNYGNLAVNLSIRAINGPDNTAILCSSGGQWGDMQVRKILKRLNILK
jgi:hypothetical protein